MSAVPPTIRRLRRERALRTLGHVAFVFGFIVFLIISGGKFLP